MSKTIEYLTTNNIDVYYAYHEPKYFHIYKLVNNEPQFIYKIQRKLSCLSLSPDGNTLALGTWSKDVILLMLNGNTVEKKPPIPIANKNELIMDIQWKDNQTFICSTGSNVLSYNFVDKEKKTLFSSNKDIVGFAFDPKGEYLIIQTLDKIFQCVFDTESDEYIPKDSKDGCFGEGRDKHLSKLTPHWSDDGELLICVGCKNEEGMVYSMVLDRSFKGVNLTEFNSKYVFISNTKKYTYRNTSNELCNYYFIILCDEKGNIILYDTKPNSKVRNVMEASEDDKLTDCILYESEDEFKIYCIINGSLHSEDLSTIISDVEQQEIRKATSDEQQEIRKRTSDEVIKETGSKRKMELMKETINERDTVIIKETPEMNVDLSDFIEEYCKEKEISEDDLIDYKGMDNKVYLLMKENKYKYSLSAIKKDTMERICSTLCFKSNFKSPQLYIYNGYICLLTEENFVYVLDDKLQVITMYQLIKEGKEINDLKYIEKGLIVSFNNGYKYLLWSKSMYTILSQENKENDAEALELRLLGMKIVFEKGEFDKLIDQYIKTHKDKERKREFCEGVLNELKENGIETQKWEDQIKKKLK